MSDKKKVSPETQKFIDDLYKKRVSMTVNPKQFNFDIEDELDEKEFNPVLQSISYVVYKIMMFIGVLLSIAGVVNIYWVYLIYKKYQIDGLIGALTSKWLVFIVAYIVFMFIYKEIHYKLYKYSKGV